MLTQYHFLPTDCWPSSGSSVINVCQSLLLSLVQYCQLTIWLDVDPISAFQPNRLTVDSSSGDFSTVALVLTLSIDYWPSYAAVLAYCWPGFNCPCDFRSNIVSGRPQCWSKRHEYRDIRRKKESLRKILVIFNHCGMKTIIHPFLDDDMGILWLWKFENKIWKKLN